MTTDRELLELAAKAAGVEVFWSDVHETFFLIEKYNYESEFQKDAEWNPLTDCGDALRLAVKLGIYVKHYTSGKFVVAWVHPYEEIENDYSDDPYAATRRAITRAAAEIGKKL